MKLTYEIFDAIKEGDVVESESLLKGLTAHPVLLRCTEREGDRLKFVATFRDVTLGKWFVTRDTVGERLKWDF